MERITKKDDLEKCRKAHGLLVELFEMHDSEIEPALWIGPFINIVVDTYQDSGISFKDCKKGLIECINFYEYDGKKDD